jgi:predicted metalloprotease with PDZ domain
VHGQETAPHLLEILEEPSRPHWQLATSLPPHKTHTNGFGSYLASNYDELVDSPVEMGEFWSGSFVACGIPHRFVVAGAPASFDGARLLADTQAICEAEIRFWHGDTTVKGIKNVSTSRKQDVRNQPFFFKNYLFMLNAVDDGYGGLEHRNSTALICTRKDLPRLSNPALGQPSTKAKNAKPRQPEGYNTLLGLISHEYFHTWNVKQLRPCEFAQYNYTQENYTQLLWFFEGFTSYYDDLLLRRTGLIDDSAYLKLLAKTINQVLQTPGRTVQSVAQASFDAWVKYYRQDENTPNATVSYYTKGSLVALCLDLTLRQEGQNHTGRGDAGLVGTLPGRPHARGGPDCRAASAFGPLIHQRNCTVGPRHNGPATAATVGAARRHRAGRTRPDRPAAGRSRRGEFRDSHQNRFARWRSGASWLCRRRRMAGCDGWQR